MALGFHLCKLFTIFFEDGLEVARVFEEVDELVDDFGFESRGGDGVEIAGAFVFGAGAVVAIVIGAVALFGGETIQGGITASAVGDAGEKIVGSGRHAAGMVFVACGQVLVMSVARLNILDCIPGLAIDGWFTVLFDDDVTIF